MTRARPPTLRAPRPPRPLLGPRRRWTTPPLTARVKSVLLADAQVKGTKIDVDTNNGVVTLQGNVSSPSEKSRAEQLAQQVEGVKEVHNNLMAP